MSQSFQKQIKSAYAKIYAKEQIDMQKIYYLNQLNNLYAHKMLEYAVIYAGTLLLLTLPIAILGAKLYV